MFLLDLVSILQWWLTIFLIGIIFVPITNIIFSSFFDKGYIFSKIIGISVLSYAVFVLGFLKIFPFTEINTVLIAIAFLIPNLILISKYSSILISLKKSWKIFCFEEILFLGVLFFWSFIHAHQPDIHGLEKYMDYGFINSILRAKYFPPLDMWLTPLPINYYYFGHLVTAVLTKLSFISSGITFNLMLSTISALSFVCAFSIGSNLFNSLTNKKRVAKEERTSKVTKLACLTGVAGTRLTGPVLTGLITAFILNFAGNLHSLYLFFKPYANDNPVPFWNLLFFPQTFPNNYWYPNATRFIHNTIHEFPIYSSVVSDLHGHFLDIPFVLLTIAILFSLIQNAKLKIQNSFFAICDLRFAILLGFILAIMYMTNAWDGIIYLLLAALAIFVIQFRSENKKYILHTTYYILLISAGFIAFTIPFDTNFKPFASGIGILCAPKFLTDIGRFGPFLFEPNHCQRSPLWQLFILYGFFYFWVISFFIFKIKNWNLIRNWKLEIKNFSPSDIFVGILIILSTILIILPEFIYVKDIYPAHYRANTMFKLVYASFIMLSISSGYIIVRIVLSIKYYVLSREKKILTTCYILLATFIFITVFLYPYFAINSYFGDLKIYFGLNGTKYLSNLYPQDYEAILWLNKNIKNQPIILEAQGDSYTDYARVSSNTGLPTVLGWTVHEWLWRGTYDIPAPRIADVTQMYESKDLKETENLLKKYNVSLVFIGSLEKQKYPNLNEEKFLKLGKTIYQYGQTKIYKINTEVF